MMGVNYGGIRIQRKFNYYLIFKIFLFSASIIIIIHSVFYLFFPFMIYLASYSEPFEQTNNICVKSRTSDKVDLISIIKKSKKRCPFLNCTFVKRESCKKYSTVIMNDHDILKINSADEINNKRIFLILQVHNPPKNFELYNMINNIINKNIVWMISYSPESTFYLPLMHYKERNAPFDLNKLKYEFNIRDPSVLVIVDDCDMTITEGYKKLKQLAALYKVIFMGKCFNKSVSEKDKIFLIKKYKFIANLNERCCNNFVSMDYWNIILHGGIPLVEFCLSYNKYAIPNSFINILQDKGINVLLESLNKYSKNKKFYTSILSWKKLYEPFRVYPFHLDGCQMCGLYLESLKTNLNRDSSIYSLFDPNNCHSNKI
ncbi:hypothetical protein HZS_4953 [Henneguya salminicola]|nr:hypothetical protein HZS_4953 [Henneguya salminicola]